MDLNHDVKEHFGAHARGVQNFADRHKIHHRYHHESKNREAARLENLLAVPDHYVVTDAIQVEIPASTTTTLPCAYFTMQQNLYNDTPGTSIGDPYSHNDPIIMQTIAQLITTAANQNIKFSIDEWDCFHRIQNDCNSQVIIEAFKCKWRHDVPRNPANINASLNFPLYLLGNGFNNNGIGANAGYTNSYLIDESSSPFQSADFTLLVEILHKEKHTLMPGHMKEFHLSHKTPFIVHPNRFVYMANTQTYATGTAIYDYLQGGEFWLFKLCPGQLQSTTGTSGGASIGAKTNTIRMESQLHWTYKYIQNTVGKISGQSFGLTAPSATTTLQFSENPQITGTVAASYLG